MIYNRIATVSLAYWEDELVIYHHQSGDTHLLSAASLPLLEYCLRKSKFSVDELIAHCETLGDGLSETEGLIGQFLLQLKQLNIIQAADCEAK